MHQAGFYSYAKPQPFTVGFLYRWANKFRCNPKRYPLVYSGGIGVVSPSITADSPFCFRHFSPAVAKCFSLKLAILEVNWG